MGSKYDPAPSERVSEWYLSAIALSAPVQALVRANSDSMKEHVYPEDIKAIGVDVLRHRVILTYEAEAEEITTETVVRKLFERVEVP